jgi:hypothetical protein
MFDQILKYMRLRRSNFQVRRLRTVQKVVPLERGLCFDILTGLIM